MRRVACIALPEIRVELAEEREGSGPLGVVIARRGGAVKTEREGLGKARLDVVSRAGRAAGAKHAGLGVRVVAEDAVEGALARVAEVAMAFGPAAAFDVTEDVVWVEIGGCEHLHGDGRSPALPEPGRVLGEGELARGLEARVRELGHVCAVAVADGPR